MLKIFYLAAFTTIALSRTRGSYPLIYEEDSKVNLYAFIGKKVSITEFDPDVRFEKFEIDSLTGDTVFSRGYFMDYYYDAKYEVVEKLYNDVESDTIDFLVRNHYGRPFFEESEILNLSAAFSNPSSLIADLINLYCLS